MSVAVALLFDYALSCLLYARPGSDSAWLLYVADRVLAGARLYSPSTTETNPPLIVWLSVIPDLLARWLPFSPLLILKILVAAMVCAGAAWCARILYAAKLAASPLLLGLSFCAVAAVEVSRDLLGYGQFGQREQLVVILVLPYLIYAACGSKLKLGLAKRIALGVAAGCGICVKPQQILLLAAAELLLLLWTRDLHRLKRAEPFATALTVCAYVLAVALATSYYSQMVPLLKDTYWAYADTSKLVLLRSVLLDWRVWLTLVIWLGVGRYLKHPAAPLALLAAGLGAGLAYCIQGTAWAYHLFPSEALLYCALGWMALDLLSTVAEPTAPRTLVFAGLALVLVAVSLPAFHARERRQLLLAEKYRSPLSYSLAQYPPQTPVYVFSTSLGEFTDIFQNRLVWGSRYAHLWLLPAIVENERALSGGAPARKTLPPVRVRELAVMQRSNASEDLRRWKPRFVIVEYCSPAVPCQALGAMSFDLLQWFLESRSFAAEWSHYRLQFSGRFFDVYQRIP